MFRDMAIRWYQGHILESSERWVKKTLFLVVRLFPKDFGVFPTHMRHGQKSRKLGKGKTSEGEKIWKSVRIHGVQPLGCVGRKAGHSLNRASLRCTYRSPGRKEGMFA